MVELRRDKESLDKMEAILNFAKPAIDEYLVDPELFRGYSKKIISVLMSESGENLLEDDERVSAIIRKAMEIHEYIMENEMYLLSALFKAHKHGMLDRVANVMSDTSLQSTINLIEVMNTKYSEGSIQGLPEILKDEVGEHVMDTKSILESLNKIKNRRGAK